MDHRASVQFALAEASIRHVHERAHTCNARYLTLHRLQGQLAKRFNELANEVLKPHGLTHVGFTALMTLYGSSDNALNPSLVSDCTGESRPNITRVVDELVKLGLIAREPSLDDRRRHVLSLTAAGTRLIERTMPLLGERMDPVFTALSDPECDRLIELQKKLLAAADTVPPAGRSTDRPRSMP